MTVESMLIERLKERGNRNIIDYFTSMDELLQQILQVLKEINKKLGAPTITTTQATKQKLSKEEEELLKSYEEIRELLVRYGVVRTTRPPTVQLPVLSYAGINLIPTTSAPVDIVRADKIKVITNNDEYIDLAPETNVAIIYPEVDVYFNKMMTNVAVPFLLLGGSYYSLVRSKKLTRLYFRAVGTEGYVYILELMYTE